MANDKKLRETYKGATICLFVVWLISFMVIVCSYSKIKLTIGVLKAAASFVGDTWHVVFVPIMFYVLVLCYFVYVVVTYLYLYSSGTRAKNSVLPFA